IYVARAAGTYSVRATTNQGCSSSDTVHVVNVHPLPKPVLDSDPILCAGATRTYDPGLFSSYLWQDGSTNRTFTTPTAGVYTVAVRDLNGCENTSSASITTIRPLPANFLPGDTALCTYGTLSLKPARTYKSYMWSTGSTAAQLNITHPGQYSLKVTDTQNCVGSDTILIRGKECLQGLFVPTAFTPNSDGKNDRLQVQLLGDVRFYEFRIYNRWGENVFVSKDAQRVWDGKVAGREEPSGVYVWVCNYLLAGGTSKQEKGSFVLIR
ncbi:MAG TPA: gliding motility-associated C-terminal domain-containing protein, partial [Flavisolibacter sp.]|nr:gliding motility-associated C-terminal domain-containing protein [Flavisolibacter sp.]